MTIKHYDCVYVDNNNIRRVWVVPAQNAFNVQRQFKELVGQGRIVSIRETDDFDW